MDKENLNQDLQEWIEALENIILTDGSQHATEVLKRIYQEAKLKGFPRILSVL